MTKNTLLFFLIATVATACAVRPKAEFRDAFVPDPPDYSRISAWAAHPDLDDPADRRPDPEWPDIQQSALVDVFFLHPTTFTGRSRHISWNGPVDDPKLNEKTDQSTILYQASIFNGAGRVFAPRYRQAHLNAYFTQDKNSAKQAFEIAYSDVKAAFLYYMDHFNKGRPVIIAAHSQGTTHSIRLLQEFFDGAPLQDQLVGAYLVGMPVPENTFSRIPACESPDQTGCYCSWRTFKKGYQPPPQLPAGNHIAVTNPLTWEKSQPSAPRNLNKGAVIKRFDKILPEVTDALIWNGLLLASKPRFPGSFLLTRKNYHIGDFNLYYMNVRENAILRAERYLEKNP